MGWKINPDTISKTLSNLLPKSTKPTRKTGSLGGRKISVAEAQTTKGLKETKSHSSKRHRIALSARQADTVWGKSLISIGLAKKGSSPQSPEATSMPVYASLPKSIVVNELRKTPEETSALPKMDSDTMMEDAVGKLQLEVSENKEGAGQFGEVRAAVSSKKFPSKPMRALKTTFNHNQSLEIELQGRLKHPNIARLKNAWRSEGVYQEGKKTGQAEALEMEFVGQSLQNIITPEQKLKRLKPSETPVPEKLAALKSNEAEPLPPRLLKKVAAGTVNALHFMHMQKPPIAHFDVHPGNILVGGDGKAKLTDFGCAKECLSDGSFNGNSSLNAKYNGPELWVQPPTLTPKSDMWALGCTLFEAATGESLCSISPLMQSASQRAEFITTSAENALEHPILQTEENEGLKDLLSHLLDPDPETRFSTTDTMRHSYFASARKN